jgi:hypothetical protein
MNNTVRVPVLFHRHAAARVPVLFHRHAAARVPFHRHAAARVPFHFISFHFISFHFINNACIYTQYSRASCDHSFYSPETAGLPMFGREYETSALFSIGSEYPDADVFERDHHK